MLEIITKIFLNDLKGYGRTKCMICGRKTNLSSQPSMSIAVMKTFGNCVCSNCVDDAANGRKDVITYKTYIGKGLLYQR